MSPNQRAPSLFAKNSVDRFTSISHKLDRMAGHFSDVLNCEKPVNNDILLQIACAPSSPEAEALSEPLTVAEIIRALHLLWKGKVLGEDDISVELLQLGGSAVVEAMKSWLTKYGSRSQFQLTGAIFKNKGSRGQCDNYRGISLLSAASKVISKAILTHIEQVVECQLSKSQCGFSQGCGCAD